MFDTNQIHSQMGAPTTGAGPVQQKEVEQYVHYYGGLMRNSTQQVQAFGQRNKTHGKDGMPFGLRWGVGVEGGGWGGGLGGGFGRGLGLGLGLGWAGAGAGVGVRVRVGVGVEFGVG
jgi:hypothetical protein